LTAADTRISATMTDMITKIRKALGAKASNMMDGSPRRLAKRGSF
jgi:hypothetical protein